jgi:ubiquinone/menaquinone biosynthesis C-methylase UbiE
VHRSAAPSHYDDEAEHYDVLNEANTRTINETIETILKRHGVETVLDLTCGTGSQLFWLAERGYKVTGADINAKMLERARSKGSQLDVTLLEGDMRTLQAGKFDAAITIFNAIGHLTIADFEKALRNIRDNLNEEGLYIFDIFSLEYLLHGDNISALTIDWHRELGGQRVRKVQYSTISETGVLASYTTAIIDEVPVAHSEQTLQVYSAQQLSELLERNGYELICQTSVDGTPFVPTETDRILTVARC